VGLDLAAPRQRHQVIAYGLGTAEAGGRTTATAGADLRYALNTGVALSATVHPDFATIETDREQVNLTRFELSIPEKRLFFLEGTELFQQRIRTFYSRRISDIRGGAKLLGKQGPWTVALLYANAEPTGSTPTANYAVTRFQRDVLGRSTMALTVANRTAAGSNQGSVSADATLFFSKQFGMTTQVVESYGRFGAASHAFFLRPSYDTPNAHFHVRYTELGERFADNVNGIGFIRDDDRRELDSAIEKSFFFARGPVAQIEYSSNYNIYWSRATGRRRSWEISQGVDIELRNRLALEFNHVRDAQRFEEDFRNHRSEVGVGYNTREFQSAAVGVQWGRNFTADFTLVSAEVRLKPTAGLSLEYQLERFRLDPDLEGESTWIHVGRVNQFFTKDLFLRVVVQSSSRIDRREVQAVFVYRYLPPFGTLQLAFERGTAEFGERSSQGNTFFLKATTVF
jgi:hypothetical protein